MGQITVHSYNRLGKGSSAYKSGIPYFDYLVDFDIIYPTPCMKDIISHNIIRPVFL